MAVEDNVAAMRIRFFTHDLEAMLQQFHASASVSLIPSAGSDSLFLDYFNRHFLLIASSDTLQATIASSGEDRDVWWYELTFVAPSAIERLEITNRLLFGLFDDQRNIVYISHFPSNQRETLYCVAGASDYAVNFRMQ